MRIGVRVPQYGSTWPQVRDAAARIESAGFDGIWVNDHLRSPGRLATEPAFDAFTTLAALAPLTRRARLGIAVLSASYRPPALAAKMASVIDTIAGGRLVVGLGAGSDRDEHAAYDVPFGTPAERTAGVARTLDVMRRMAADPDGPMPNRPAAAPPIWLAAHGPRLLRLAGKRADGIVGAWVAPAEMAARLAVADEARQDAGRPPLACCLYTFAFTYPSEREGLAWLAAEAEALATTPASLLRWLRTTGIVGTVDEVRDRLGEYGPAGVTDAVLAMPSRLPPDAIDALAEAALDRKGRASSAAPSGGGRDNLYDLLVTRHLRAGRGDDAAVIDDTGRWTFAELDAAAARAAGRLAEAGVRRGDRVAVILPDGRAWCAAFLGAARLGAVAAPLEPGGRHTPGVVEDLDPVAMVASDAEALPGDAARVAPDELAAGPPLPGVADVHPEDLAYMIFSSGSTGRPKGAMHAHRDLRASVEGYAEAILGLGPGDRCMSVARLFASLGFGNGFFRPLGHGATCVMSARRPTVRSVLGAVERHGVTVLSAVPTFWAQLATFLDRHPDPAALSGVRLTVSSGDALPAAVGSRLREATGVPLVEGLGCSECSNIVISTRSEEPMPGALGRVVPGVEVRLADEDGLPVPSGTPGHLWIRSPSNTSGYWRRSDETRELLFGPWIRMGDVLREDGGVYRHLGRADDLFKVDAKWVSPVEVEGALHEHPAVREAAVVGLPDPDGLLRVAAYVVPADPGADQAAVADALRRHVAHRLSTHMAPATVTLVDSLPRGATGKVDRRALRTL